MSRHHWRYSELLGIELDRVTGKSLIVIGCGSQARYVIDAVAPDTLHISGLVDVESGSMVGEEINGILVRWSLEQAFSQLTPDKHVLVVAYGNNQEKRDLSKRFAEAGFRFTSVIHPRAHVSPTADIAPGAIVNSLAAVLPNASIGNHAVIHSGAVIEHDNTIGDYANIGPGVSFGGNVEVGEGAYVYTGATVIPKLTIGKWAVVAAGTVVIEDVPDHARVVGNPARRIG